MKDQLKMILYLHTYQNPIQSKDIEAKLEISGEKLRHLINELRGEEHPIGSDRRGYYWAKTRAELNPTIENLEGREIGIRKARHGLENCFSNKDQMSLL